MSKRETLLSDRYKYAVELAADLFKDIRRDVSGLPFVTHLYTVSHITQQVTDDEDVHIAALLHDVLEDIDPAVYGPDDMERDFGPRILELVRTVSYDEVNYSKDESRKQYLEQIKSGSLEACIISAADLRHNAGDIIDLYKKIPAKIEAVFGGERAKRRQWFWDSRLEILTERLGKDHPLVQDLQAIWPGFTRVNQKLCTI